MRRACLTHLPRSKSRRAVSKRKGVKRLTPSKYKQTTGNRVPCRAVPWHPALNTHGCDLGQRHTKAPLKSPKAKKCACMQPYTAQMLPHRVAAPETGAGTAARASSRVNWLRCRFQHLPHHSRRSAPGTFPAGLNWRSQNPSAALAGQACWLASPRGNWLRCRLLHLPHHSRRRHKVHSQLGFVRGHIIAQPRPCQLQG